ncbi:MAG: hypothetical protein HQK49_00790 [Oligoflexia bacterium]|nr:hypothetical protein [Oligoflexia bacterium]
MKLELANGLIKKELFEELEIENYFKLFDLDIPLLQHKILNFLTQEEGFDHFQSLKEIEDRIGNETIDKIISQSRSLANLDKILPLFQSGKLQLYQFYTLGNYLVSELEIIKMEEKDGVENRNKISLLAKLVKLLEEYLEDNFRNFLIPENFSDTLTEIKILEDNISKAITEYEKDILQQTKLKMLYPYPKEVSAQEVSKNKKIEKSPLLTVSKQSGHSYSYYLIDYQLPKSIKSQISKKDKLALNLSQELENKLQQLNNKIKKFYPEFNKCYQQRLELTFNYCLVWCKQRYSLSFPTFQTFPTNLHYSFTIQEGILPALKNKEEKQKRYTPLSIDIENGSNVLFGGNMSGKTTLLKTIYFLLMMIKIGLPIPAKKLSISKFPSQILIHLPSYGNLQTGLSSFAEEMNFFSQKFETGSVVLVDELFKSTNPLSGAMLSNIFLEEFSDSKKEILFFCSTHYTEVLSNNSISLYRMSEGSEGNEGNNTNKEFSVELFCKREDNSSSDKSDRDKNLQTWAHNNLKRPLSLALNFSISETIKEKIKLSLKE